jgi:glycosyltransferase involved in cell wall biosynthesis
MSGIALAHDYFVQMGGAEKVAECLHQLFPTSPIYTTVMEFDKLPPALKAAKIRTSWMQGMPGLSRNFRKYFMIYPWAVESLDLSEFSLVISSSSGYAKGIRRAKNAVHVCYCHTPMRWAWRYEDYAEREQFGIVSRTSLPVLLAGLRKWDLRAARQPDYYIANSKAVSERIKKIYQRESTVINPPIDTGRFRPSSDVREHFLILSRLVPYKRIDLAVEAFNKSGLPLVVIGDGPDRKRLESMAKPNIRFMGRQTDSVVEFYASRCRALIFPGEEDFGMTPLEVNAAGRPVIAFAAGGALETVNEGITGIFFHDATADSLASAVERFETMRWESKAIRQHSQQFSIEAFREKMLNFLLTVAPVDCRAELSAAFAAVPELPERLTA